MLRCFAFIAALMLASFTAFQACADRRVALVIGNSEYREIPASRIRTRRDWNKSSAKSYAKENGSRTLL